MTRSWISPACLPLIIVHLCLAVPSVVQAATEGSAYVDMFAPPPVGLAKKTFTISTIATQYQTPDANLNRQGFATGDVHAVAGIDLPGGALSAWSAGKGVSSGEGSYDQVAADSLSRVYFTDRLQLRSLTFVPATPVELSFRAITFFDSEGSASGQPNCCHFGIEAQSYVNASVVGGSGEGFQEVWHQAGGTGQHDFGTAVLHSQIGAEISLELELKTSLTIYAAAAHTVDDPDSPLVNGHVNAAMTAALVFGWDGVVPGAAAAANPAADAGALAATGSDVYLFSPALGGALPGFEAFDPANVAAHLLPLHPVPEPWAATLSVLGIVCLAAAQPRWRAR